jgi:hypothetical protein
MFPWSTNPHSLIFRPRASRISFASLAKPFSLIDDATRWSPIRPSHPMSKEAMTSGMIPRYRFIRRLPSPVSRSGVRPGRGRTGGGCPVRVFAGDRGTAGITGHGLAGRQGRLRTTYCCRVELVVHHGDVECHVAGVSDVVLPGDLRALRDSRPWRRRGSDAVGELLHFDGRL